MPGEFKVRGTLILSARKRLIIYGDIVNGTVASGEELRVRLNSSSAVRVPIESVEMVDGTATGSHVALIVSEDASLRHNLMQALGLSGETFAVVESVE